MHISLRFWSRNHEQTAKARASEETGEAAQREPETEAAQTSEEGYRRARRMIVHASAGMCEKQPSLFAVWLNKMQKTPLQVYIVFFLGTIALAGIFASFFLAIQGKPTPDMVIGLGFAAVGALANALTGNSGKPGDGQKEGERSSIGSLLER